MTAKVVSMIAGTRLVHISVGLVLTLEHNSLVLVLDTFQKNHTSRDLVVNPFKNFFTSFGPGIKVIHKVTLSFIPYLLSQKDPQQGKEAAAPSNIREIQEIQGGQEAPHNGGAISPKDA